MMNDDFFVARAFFTYLNSFSYAYATSSYPTKNTVGHGTFAPVVPVTLYHKETNAPVPITGGMLVDTGAEDSVISEKYAKLIGLDHKKNGVAYNVGGVGGKVTGTYYMNKIPMKIGGLKPIAVNALFGPTLDDDQVLGRTTLRLFITSLTQQQIQVAEYATQAATTAAKKSAYVRALHGAILASSSNAQSHYRNRI